MLRNMHNRTLIGIIAIDYPVYLVHLEYKKQDDDPMYYIDWSIVKFIEYQPITDKSSLAKIIGLDDNLVIYRIKRLKEEGVIRENEKGYQITSFGRERFSLANNELPYINDSSDFLIDGINLKPMNKIFYENKGYIRFNRNSIITRTIIKNKDDENINNLVKQIERMPNEKKLSFGLPANSKEYVSVDTPSAGLLKIFIAFSCDKKNLCYKELVYSNTIVNLPAIKEVIDKSYFYGNMSFSYGYSNFEDKFLKNKVCLFNITDMKNIFKDWLCWDEKSFNDTCYYYGSESLKRPITINLNIENFKTNKKPLRILSALKNGFYEIGSKDWIFRLTVTTKDKGVEEISHINDCIVKSKKEHDLMDIDDIYNQFGYEKVRKIMIFLKQFEYIEQIDNQKFIKEI